MIANGSYGADAGSAGQDAPKRESRRMALLKRAGLFGSNTSGADITRATSLKDLLEAYKLVHDEFVAMGYIKPRPSGLRVRSYEALPETATFVAKVGDRVVGVQSIVVDSPDMGLPSDEAFHTELEGLRANGRRVCECTNEAIASDYRKSAVTTELMRCCFAHALSVGCNELITTVSPGHARFYNLLGFGQVSPIRSYSQEMNDPVVVVSMNIDGLEARFAEVNSTDGNDEAFIKGYYIDDNPYHSYVRAWTEMAGRVFRDPELLWELFVNRTALLAQCDCREIEAIRRRWGKAFAGVIDPASTHAYSVA